jgi:steroid delta-isomerase-like uncharacterized protein
MNALDVAQASFDAWNGHDPDAIAALYAKDATYFTPRAGEVLTGQQAIADFARKVFTVYPDYSMELISRGEIGQGLVACQWVIHATHTGPFWDGSPPTGRSLTLPGASFTQVEGDKIRSDQTYLNLQSVSEQLGLKPK